MKLEEQAEELLETLWIRIEEKRDGLPQAEAEGGGSPALNTLTQAGYVRLTDGKIELTEAGKPEASSVVRRHRLAERLLADVLGTVEDQLTHEKACKFEHLLDRGLDESICTLLGHPKICPHGKPIPPGRCCGEADILPHKLVSPLSELAPGQKGKVAYIYAPESAKLHKLIAMGIHPGAGITLIQGFPSYVFRAGQTEFAVDRGIADSIYIRLVEETPNPALPEAGTPKRRRFRFRRGLARG